MKKMTKKKLEIDFKTELINELRKLLNRSINLNKKIIYEWKISFYIGLLLQIVFFMLGISIGVLYGEL